jgi:hypothetical protein
MKEFFEFLKYLIGNGFVPAAIGALVSWTLLRRNYKVYQREEIWRLVRWAIEQISKNDFEKTFLSIKILSSLSNSSLLQKEDEKVINAIMKDTFEIYKKYAEDVKNEK